MTVNPDQNQAPAIEKPSDKELNFRNLEAKYQKELEKERLARIELERQIQERNMKHDEDDDDSEPYVDNKKLTKKLNNFGQKTQSEIQKAMELAKETAKEELKREIWLEQNPDFTEVLKHADKLAERSPRLAETILKMPEGFDRQKLVYEYIKTMELHKPPVKQSSIQEKIDANRKSPYYQPSGVANAPYAAAGDFSPEGQKNAYAKMKEMQARLKG